MPRHVLTLTDVLMRLDWVRRHDTYAGIKRFPMICHSLQKGVCHLARRSQRLRRLSVHLNSMWLRCFIVNRTALLRSSLFGRTPSCDASGFTRRDPAMARAVASRFSPDILLDGTNAGVPAPPVIALPDRDRRVRLPEFFRALRQRRS